MDTASHQTLDTEFGTHKDEEVIVKILEKGDIHDVEVCMVLCHFHPLPFAASGFCRRGMEKLMNCIYVIGARSIKQQKHHEGVRCGTLTAGQWRDVEVV